MRSIEQLLSATPPWIKIDSSTQEEIRLTAKPTKPSGEPGRSYFLLIKSRLGDRITVQEIEGKELLPACCVERHINSDSTFCLFYSSNRPVVDYAEATTWWNALSDYLLNQDIAEVQKKWPVRGQLSHGDAAQVQLKMEELAIPLSWRDEILMSIFREDGWLAGPLPRRSNDKKSLVNVRNPCPRGCVRKHGILRSRSCTQKKCIDGCRRVHKPILRKECPHRSTVEKLVLLEYQRRTEEEKIYKDLRERGIKCCGTMKNCKL